MKKIGMWMAVSIMVVGLISCAGDKGNENGGTQSGSQSGTQENQSSASGTDNNGEGGQGSTGNQDSTQDSAEDVIGWSDEMETLRNVVEDTLGENYWPDTKIDADMLETIYGVAPDMYEDYLGEMPAISANVDTLLVIKATNDTAEQVENILTEYREDVVQNSMQYPMNLGKVQASRIERVGNYVCFVQLGGDTMGAMDVSDEEVIRHCQEQNELAIAVIEKQLVQ